MNRIVIVHPRDLKYLTVRVIQGAHFGTNSSFDGSCGEVHITAEFKGQKVTSKHPYETGPIDNVVERMSDSVKIRARELKNDYRKQCEKGPVEIDLDKVLAACLESQGSYQRARS